MVQLRAAPEPEQTVALHPAALARYEAQLAQLQQTIAAGIAAGDHDAAEAIRELVTSVTVRRDKGKPGGVAVEIAGRLEALLERPSNKARLMFAKSVGKVVPRKGFEPPTPALRMRCSTG